MAVRRVYGAAVIAAPLLLASSIACITAGEGIKHGELGGTIGVWSVSAFVIGLTGFRT